MKTAVITVVHGRTQHLRNQLRGRQFSHQPPKQHVIVAVEDSTVTDTVADCGALATVVSSRAPRRACLVRYESSFILPMGGCRRRVEGDYRPVAWKTTRRPISTA
jgi:hypothetical protein